MWIQKQTRQFLRLQKYVAPLSTYFTYRRLTPIASLHVGPELQTLFRLHLNLLGGAVIVNRGYCHAAPSRASNP